MAEIGSYDWWRSNYAENSDFKAVCSVLQKWGVDCSEVEVDHFPPNAAYTGTRYESLLSYGARPAFPLAKYLHRYRKGDGGMGAHASTTGSTTVSKAWTPQLHEHMAGGDFYGAMKSDIIDKQNVALAAAGNGGSLTANSRNLFNKLLLPAVDLARAHGLIDSSQYFDLRLNYLGVPL